MALAVDAPIISVPSGADTISFVDPEGNETVLLHQKGMTGRWMPPVMMSDETVPGQDGTRFRQVRYDARQVVVPVVLLEESRADYRAAIRTLVRRLDPKRGEGILRSTWAGQTRELACRYLDGMGFDERFLNIGTPSLLFRAFDPFWTDGSDTAVAVGATSASFFPFFPLRLSGSEVYADTTVDNDGDVEAWPLWTVTGPGNDPILRNLTTGKSIDLTGLSLAAGETVEIDTRPGIKTVRDGAGANLYGSMTTASSLFPLAEGSNSLRLEMSASTTDTSFSLRYRRRWLSA